MRRIVALRQISALVTSSLCVPTLTQNNVQKVVLFSFRRHFHLLPQLMCIVFSLSVENLGKIVELDPKRDKNQWAASGLYFSSIEYATMGHMVLDLTSLAYQPETRERSVRRRNM